MKPEGLEDFNLTGVLAFILFSHSSDEERRQDMFSCVLAYVQVEGTYTYTHRNSSHFLCSLVSHLVNFSQPNVGRVEC